MSEHEHLFTRDGRLSELSLARFANDELDAGERAAVERALADDAQARALLDELRTDGLAPPPQLAPPLELAARRPRANPWLAVLGLAAAAALVAWLLARPGPPTHDGPLVRVDTHDADTSDASDDAGIRTKGESFAFELWIDDGERNHRVRSGDEVDAGDKLAFRVYPRVAGELLIVCIDPEGVALGCWPSQGFASVEARGDALTIAPGLAFDAAPGEERFVALLCSDPPPREQVLAEPDAAWPTCAVESIHVRKASEQ